MADSKRAGSRVSDRPLIRDFDDAEAEISESTTLLGSGDSNGDDGASSPQKGSWDGLDEFEGLSWWKTPSVFWLLFPYAIFTLSFGGIIVPKLNIILDLVCKQYFADQTLLDPTFTAAPVLLGSDNKQCKIPAVEKSVASFLLAMNLCTGLLSAIVAPKLGHLSDRYGRRKLLALATCGGLLAELITILAAKFPETVDYRWLILGSIFDGMTGSFTAGSILTQSYTSDCTPPSKRAVAIGYIHACLFSGLAFGPMLAGYFVKWTGSLLSIFYVVMGCHMTFIILVGFLIPESLSKKKRQAAQEKWDEEQRERAQRPETWLSTIQETNPFRPLKALWPTGPGTSRKLRVNLVALALNDTIIMGAGMASGAVVILYAEHTFDWGVFEASQFVSLLSLVRVVVLMGIFPIINYFGRIRPAAQRRRASGITPVDKNSGADRMDIWIVRVALASDILGCVGYLLSRNAAPFVASGMVTALGGLGGATIQAVVTKHVPTKRVGQVLGAVGMLHAITRVVGPVMFNGLYALTVEHFPQAIFVLLCSLFAFALFAMLFVKPHVHWEEDTDEETEPLNAPQRAYDANSDALLEEDQIRVQ